MRRRRAVFVLLIPFVPAAVTCVPTEFSYLPDTDDAGEAGADGFSASDGTSAADVDGTTPIPSPCDLAAPFAAPTAIRSLNTADNESTPRLSPDERTVFFDAVRVRLDGGTPVYDVYFAVRPDRGDTFGPRALLIPAYDGGLDQYSAAVTDDGLTLFLERQERNRENSNILVSRRRKAEGPFGLPTPVNNVNTSGYEANPFIRGDAKELWFVATGAATTIDIFHATTTDGVSYTAAPLAGPVSSPAFADFTPVISADAKTLYFSSDRPLPGFESFNIWTATRATPAEAFGDPRPVENVNSNRDEYPGWVSPDGCRLYLMSNRAGGRGLTDIYVAERPAR